jgi:hypothetical protein
MLPSCLVVERLDSLPAAVVKTVCRGLCYLPSQHQKNREPAKVFMWGRPPSTVQAAEKFL